MGHFVMTNERGQPTGFGTSENGLEDFQAIAGEVSRPIALLPSELFIRTQWWNGEAFAAREGLPAVVDKLSFVADGVDSAVITELPDPCIVTIDGDPHDVLGGTLTLRSEMPETYEIGVDHWPYLPWSVTVEAV